jgi:hypothetical protein
MSKSFKIGDCITTDCHMCRKRHIAEIKTCIDVNDPPFLPMGWIRVQVTNSEYAKEVKICSVCSLEFLRVLNKLKG